MNPNEDGWRLNDEEEAAFRLREMDKKKYKVYWTEHGRICSEGWEIEDDAKQHRDYLRQHVDPNAYAVKS